MDLYSLYTTGILVGQAAALLSLIIAGVKFVLSMGAPERIEDAKNQVLASLLGLFIITFLPAILHFANPDLPSIQEIFTKPLTGPPAVTVTREQLAGIPGVYVTTTDGKEYLLGWSSPDLGPELNNKITEIKFVDGPNNIYGVVIFDEAGYKGRCEDYTPYDPVSNKLEEEFTSSAMVYSYPPGSSPADGYLALYRKAFYDETGGINAGAISPSIDWFYLENWTFANIPEDELKCIEWNGAGKCIKRKEPTLDGDNIGSIEISDNISVLLVSDGTVEEEKGNYFCQLFWNKGGTYSAANLKNEYLRAKERYPYVIKILPGHP